MRAKRCLSAILTLCMLLILIPRDIVASADENQAQDGLLDILTNGIEVSKSGQTSSDNVIHFDTGNAEIVGNSESAILQAVPIEGSFNEATSNSERTIYISTAEELIAIADDLDANYFLTADINLDGNDSQQWTAIGSLSAPFSGTFDGNGHTISGMYIDNGAEYQGLFGYAKNAQISNFTLIGDVAGKYKNTGSVVGYLSGGHVENVSTFCSLSGFDAVGGVVGYNDEGLIVNCKNYLDIDKEWNFSSGTNYSTYGEMSIGGIAGVNTGTIYNCVNYGKVRIAISVDNSSSSFSQKMRLGGITGYNKLGYVTECKNSGFVYAIANVDEYSASLTYYGYVGGIVGSSNGKIRPVRKPVKRRVESCKFHKSRRREGRIFSVCFCSDKRGYENA